MIEIKLVSGESKVFKTNYFDCLKYIFCMMLKLCYSTDKASSRRGYIFKYYNVSRLHTNHYPKVNSLFLLYNKKKEEEKIKNLRQTQQ